MITHLKRHGTIENFHVDTFQHYDIQLASRLLEVYESNVTGHLVCIPYAFKDSSIEILARIKTTPQEQWMIKRKFNQMIKERFEKEGIEIPFPQLVVTKTEEQKENI